MAKDNKNQNTHFKITVISIVAAVWLVCIALVCTKCELDKRNAENSLQTGTDNAQTQTLEEQIEKYETNETGTVKTEDSKTYKYFNSHYKGDYTTVTEYKINSDENGEYYQTEKISYSAQGYKYKEVYMTTYEETELYAGNMDYIAYLYTPEKYYLLYPGTMTYKESERTSEASENGISFENTSFKTGVISIRGGEYEYESTTSADGTETIYCLDKNDNIKFVITNAPNGKVFTTYISYKDGADYSLFQLPEGYSPM